ncbi:HAD family hydrolase [Curtobacterium sp. PhB115]|uniref:HAD family hydrolase n=1 Tax=Curtobacterium sp. PhB115 TaxID=2485173 RepID=UPI000F4BAD48|nr:HAD family hydrolase [Curtobacterium sp. PhB115]ROP66702.1 hydroxymethylpyrimidine pyrophosphatase-like HAD family hydrolase [Curtobacterium sp. PhB115]
MSALVGFDLDRTLVYSAAALLLDGPDESAPALVVTEVYQHAPLSYMTRVAETALAGLASRATVVPVTTRTVAQYRRIRLPLPTEGWAVTTNGAVLLHDDRPDDAWTASLRAEIDATSAPLAAAEELFLAQLPTAALLRNHRAEDLFVYAVVDRAALPDDALADLAAALGALGWTVSLQGRKLYAVPVAIRKERALAAVAERVGATLTVAAGDSLLDRDMLAAADVAIRPAHGELHAAGWTAPNLLVTQASGVMAGQEIIELAARAVDGAR